MTFSVCQNRTSCGACSLFSASPSLQATIPFSHPVRAVQPHTTDGKPKGLSKKTAEGRHCWHKINSFSWYSPSWSFQEWKQLGKGCMRCLDSGGTRLWPLLLKQPHTALTARTLHSYHMLLAGKGYGLAKGNFPLYFVKIKNSYQHHNICLKHDIHAVIFLSMYHARKPLRQFIQLQGTNHFGSKYIWC